MNPKRWSSVLRTGLVFVVIVGFGASSSQALAVVSGSDRAHDTTKALPLLSIVNDPQTVGRYMPATIEVKIGQKVRVTNTSDATHTLTDAKNAFDSGSIQPGGHWNYTPRKVGTFKYFCQFHPLMHGTIVVVPARPRAGGQRTKSGTTSLSLAALRVSDLPVGYGKPIAKAYPVFAAKMVLGSSSSTTCTAPPGITRTIWRYGLISESDRGSIQKGTAHSVGVCAWRLTNAISAHAAYAANARKMIAIRGVHSLVVPMVGNESVAAAVPTPFAPTYILFFRHADTLVGLFYVSIGKKADLTMSGLRHIATGIDHRLK